MEYIASGPRFFLTGTNVYGRILPPLLFALLLTGCGTNPKPKTPPPPPAIRTSAFNELTTGDLMGRVVWKGVVPTVPPYLSPANPLSETSPRRGLREWANVNAPTIDAEGGVGGAVVYLRGVDPDQAKPWELPPVRVEIADYQIHVRQGEEVGRCGFVRRGDTVDFVSKQAVFDTVQARGAAFFALPFPDPDQVRRRTLNRVGVVEMTSGAGRYWMRGYLFVVDHPYITQTDAAGRFSLANVPPGKYELVVWHPNWQEAAHSRDADTCQVCRLTLQPPLEVVRPIEVPAGGSVDVDIPLAP